MAASDPETATQTLTTQLSAWPLVVGFNGWCALHPALQWVAKVPLLLLAVLWLPVTVTYMVVVALVDEARGFGWKRSLLGYSKAQFEVRRGAPAT